MPDATSVNATDNPTVTRASTRQSSGAGPDVWACSRAQGGPPPWPVPASAPGWWGAADGVTDGATDEEADTTDGVTDGVTDEEADTTDGVTDEEADTTDETDVAVAVGWVAALAVAVALAALRSQGGPPTPEAGPSGWATSGAVGSHWRM